MSLTGGTRDVSPQLFHMRATQTAADTTTTETFPVPIQRLPFGNRAQVMEVLKAYFVTTSLPAIASATEIQDVIQIFITTTSFGTTATNFGEPRVFAHYVKNQRGAFTAAGTYGMTQDDEPFQLDLTDGAGHGILVATDNIFMQIASSGTGASNTANVKLLYRWKNVPLQEYIGIVQSQQ